MDNRSKLIFLGALVLLIPVSAILDVLLVPLLSRQPVAQAAPRQISAVPGKTIGIAEIDRLIADGSPDAQEQLYHALISPQTEQWVKRLALVRLGKRGTPEAITVVDRFTTWAQQRPDYNKPFHFGDRGYPLKLEQQTAGPDGTQWALFSIGLYTGNTKRPTRKAVWWITHTTDGNTWAPPVFVGDPQYPDKLLAEMAKTGKIEESWLRDRDGDGITDEFEAFLGTNPTVKDSDGDGEIDGVDPCPLTPRQKKRDDAGAIRQAVFTLVYGTQTGMELLIPGKSLHPHETSMPAQMQEFDGVCGWIVPLKGDYRGNTFAMAITSRTASRAEVQVDFWTMGERYMLEKKQGRWVVVDIQKTWIT